MNQTEVLPIKVRKDSKFPWNFPKRIHAALYPASAEFFLNTGRGTITLLALLSLDNMINASNPQDSLESAARFYETLIYLN